MHVSRQRTAVTGSLLALLMLSAGRSEPHTPIATTPATSVSARRSASEPPTRRPTTGPVVLAGDRLSTAGIGDLLLGMPVTELAARGVYVPNYGCADPIPSLTAEGVFTLIPTPDGRIQYIEVRDARHPTLSGIAVGMTVARISQTYGSKVTLESLTFDGTTEKYKAYVFHGDGVAMIFGASSPSSNPSDTIRVIAIMSDKEAYGLPYEYEC